MKSPTQDQVRRYADMLAAMGAEPNLLVGEEYGKMIRGETARWSEVVKAAGIKVE